MNAVSAARAAQLWAQYGPLYRIKHEHRSAVEEQVGMLLLAAARQQRRRRRRRQRLIYVQPSPDTQSHGCTHTHAHAQRTAYSVHTHACMRTTHAGTDVLDIRTRECTSLRAARRHHPQVVRQVVHKDRDWKSLPLLGTARYCTAVSGRLRG